jgi:soluble lytic murein transglycosylase
VFSILFLCAAGGIFFEKPSEAASLTELFWKRSWAEMDRVYASGGNFSAAEHSLMANALRLRAKWAEAVSILEKHAASFPEAVRPYADMTLLLGFEKLGRYAEAAELAARMEKNAPDDLRHPLAYARFRLLESGSSDGNKPLGEIEKALNGMLETAGTRAEKTAALERLIALPGDRRAQAIALLTLRPSDEAAGKLLSASPKPWGASQLLAMGEHAWLKNDYKTAIALLAGVPRNAEGGRKAAYYRAFALSRTKSRAEALNLWGGLALSGNAYAESSVRRVAALAGTAGKPGALRADASAVLRRVVKERKGRVQARAMLALLASGVPEEEAKELENALIQACPDWPETLKILWTRGWEAWNAKNLEEAVRCWTRARAPGVSAVSSARFLYWLASAQTSLGAEEAEKTYAALASDHPLSIYTFLARPDAVRLLDGDPPELAADPSPLEQYGFVLYARIRARRPDAPPEELYRSSALSEWLGEPAEAYSQALPLTRILVSGTTLYRKGLERLYPRPFRKEVEAACEKYGVEDSFVWAVMRQESAFKTGAVSHAGAAGLMQLMPGTAKDEAKRMGLKGYKIHDAADNIAIGTAHLAHLRRSFEREDWIMAAYNAGGGNARKWLAEERRDLAADYWIEEVRFAETHDYVQKVSGNLETYRMLYEEEPH